LQNTGLYERIILKWALKNLVVRAWCVSGYNQFAGCNKPSNEDM
jgi:hypothetical protein